MEGNKQNFYHDETVDIYDPINNISSEAIVKSIRGDIFVIKHTNSNQEEVIRNNSKILISQCKPLEKAFFNLFF